MKRSLLAAVLLLVALTAGCRKTLLSPAVDRLLDDPNAQLTVASVYPWPNTEITPEYRNNPRVNGFAILKSRVISNPAERQRLINGLRAEIGGPFGLITCVFEPHHALMLRTPKASSDIVICFKCGEVQWAERWGKHETHPPSRLIGKRLLPLLDAVLQRP